MMSPATAKQEYTLDPENWNEFRDKSMVSGFTLMVPLVHLFKFLIDSSTVREVLS
jgi:hypothetical protein